MYFMFSAMGTLGALDLHVHNLRRKEQASMQKINKDRKVIKCSFIAPQIRKQFLWFHPSLYFLHMRKSTYSDRTIEVSVINNYWRGCLKVQKIGDGEAPWEKKYSGDFNFQLMHRTIFSKKLISIRDHFWMIPWLQLWPFGQTGKKIWKVRGSF